LVDQSIVIGHDLLWLDVHKYFFEYGLPFLASFFAMMFINLGNRMVMQGRAPFCFRWIVGGLGPALLVAGISGAIRTRWMCLPYGCGWGLAMTLFSYVHTIQLYPFQVVTRKQAGRALMTKVQGK
jgi:hypothetical protein